MKEALLRLKSGTDIRGVAYAELGIPRALTEDIGSMLGAAFARWLAQRLPAQETGIQVAVGRDSRVTGEALARAIARGLASEGVIVLDCGLATTPAMFMSTMLVGADAAVMVTASHLPWQRNGYKFFTAEGGLDGEDIDAILAMAAGIAPIGRDAPAVATNLLAAYSRFLRERMEAVLGTERPLSGLHIAVDAGNGSGGFYAQMLGSLGADVSGSQYLEPDGRFPHHAPNPEDPVAMQALSDAVLRSGADLGVIFDADCDRAAMVGEDGRPINRNRLIALVSAILLREHPGAVIVTDSVTSAGLEAFIAGLGGRQHRFKRGYRNVIDEAKRLNAEGIDCPLAMETSGHAALRENHFLDDGMYLATRLIIEARRLAGEGKRLTSLIEGLREPASEVELRLAILAEDFRTAGQNILSEAMEAVGRMDGLRIDPENREGVRIQLGTPDTWALLRLSVHDPQLVINAESDEEDGAARALAALQAILAGRHDLDLAPLTLRINASKEEPR